jgi:hypothetical protein
MGNDVDQINRRNKCLQECAQADLKCEQVWIDYFEAGKISDRKARAEMKKCQKEHSDCIARCVPGVRHFDDDAKQHYKDLALECSGIAAVCMIAGAGAILLFEAPVAAGFMFAFSAGSIGMNFHFVSLEIDPIDPNFSKLPTPSLPKLPAVRPVRNTRLTASVAKAANAVLANQAQTIGLLNALRTALDRSDSAADAGDTSAEERQLKAARDFAKEVAEVLKDAMPLRLTLASQWTGPGLDFTISEQDALKLRDDLIINGFPRQFLDALKKLGVDQEEQDTLRQRLIISLASLSGFHQIRFRNLLTNRGLRAAEIGVISALEQFSRSQ